MQTVLIENQVVSTKYRVEIGIESYPVFAMLYAMHTNENQSRVKFLLQILAQYKFCSPPLPWFIIFLKIFQMIVALF